MITRVFALRSAGWTDELIELAFGWLIFPKGLASKMAQYGVRVNAIAPGIVATPLTKPIRDNAEWSGVYAARAAIKRWAEPSELVGPIVLLASEAGSYMTGTTVFVDGGWCAIDGRYDLPV